MTAEILNLEQIQDGISQDIEAYLNRLQSNKEIPQDQLKSLLKSLLFERELILDELNEIKDAIIAPLPLIFRKTHQTKIMMSEVDESLYNDFMELSTRLALPIGVLLSSLMKALIESEDNTFKNVSRASLQHLIHKQAKVSISHHNYLEVKKNDLQQLNETVSFSHIHCLRFTPDVDINTFMSKVKNISYCQYVNVPEKFPKLLVYAKLYGCLAVEFASPSTSILESSKDDFPSYF
ncbi:MAG: hypothetical protein ACFFDT_30015 [Candidatus Hodarchaeota archaeon]